MVQAFRLIIALEICFIIFSAQFLAAATKRVKHIKKKGQRRQSIPISIGEYPDDENTRRQGRPNPNGDVYEFHRFQHYGFKTPAPNTFNLESMLALLAPLATLPIIASAALSSMAAMLPTLTTEGMVKGRSRREAVERILGNNAYSNSSWQHSHHNDHAVFRRDIRDLDIIHKYLKQMNPKQDMNDEILASYLQCSGMLSSNNHCLERLVCQFSDQSSQMASLEKEVSSLIIYTILNNKHIKNDFKERLRKAAFFGRDKNGHCGLYTCSQRHFTS